jgi:hypothetical protein
MIGQKYNFFLQLKKERGTEGIYKDHGHGERYTEMQRDRKIYRKAKRQKDIYIYKIEYI